MDAMSKYSLEAEKYRGAYSMYPEPSRGYLDSTLSKAYMYMEQQSPRTYPMDISKMYSEASAAAAAGAAPSSASPRSAADSPDLNARGGTGPTDGASSASSASTASPGALPPYYPPGAGLLPVPQYPQHYPSSAQSSGEFRRPLTVIFWPDSL